MQAPPAFRQQFNAPSSAIPLFAQTTAPPAWLHWLTSVQLAPGAAPVVGVPAQTPFVQSRPPQQAALLAQVPPALRQQFNAPSAAIPLSAQTTAPAVWLHWLVAVQVAPNPRLLLGGVVVVPPQTPFAQRSAAQQLASSVQAPP